jgi:RNase P/RNase MRP subunit p29
MSNRSEAAISAAAGRRRRHSGLGASVLTTLVMTWMGASFDVWADSILLKSGEEIEGSIIDATRNTLIVRRSIGGMRQMRIQDVDEVRIDLAQGEQLSGQFLSWTDGVYQLRLGGQVVRISQGAILSREPREEATRQPPREPPPRPAQEPTAGMAAAPAASPPEKPAAPKAEGESQTVAVKGSVDPAETGADGMVFKIELSRPAEQMVVLIYGTLDGTAKAGRDYEPQQGVITLAPGTESGEVNVPLIEHQPSKGDKRFELFLIADPKVAEVVDDRIIATIKGAD